jgi:hypothetical protein
MLTRGNVANTLLKAPEVRDEGHRSRLRHPKQVMPEKVAAKKGQFVGIILCPKHQQIALKFLWFARGS